MAVAQPAYDGLPDLLDRIWRTTTTYALFGAYPTAIVFGVPAYILLRQRLAASLFNCTWVGAAVAAFPWVILGLLSNADYAYNNGHVTHMNGAKTLWGWIEVLLLIAWMGLLGALAGSLFWFIAKWPAPMSGRPMALTLDDVPRL